jgi:hypothetical protein
VIARLRPRGAARLAGATPLLVRAARLLVVAVVAAPLPGVLPAKSALLV